MSIGELFKLFHIYRKEEPDIDKLQEDLLMTSKPWWQSQTIWSDILTLVMAVLPQVDSIWHTHITTNPVYSMVLAVLAGWGIKGRVSATQTIGGAS